MKRAIYILATLIVMLAALGGCASSSGGGQEMPDGGENRLIDEGYPMSVTDGKGVEVVISGKPVNIVSLSLSTDEILVSLVDKSRIKALSYLSDDPGISNCTEEAKDIKEKVGQEAERIISLGPDLVLLPDWMDEAFISQLRDANIKVYVHKTPDTVNEQRQLVMEIAKLVGEEEKGSSIVAWMDEKLKEIEDRVKDIKDEDKLRVINSNFGYTYAKGSMFDDMAQKAGLVNAASEIGLEGFVEISKEKIVEMNPDMIVLSSWSYDDSTDPEAYMQDILNDRSLAEVNAVKNNRVVALQDKHLYAVSHWVVLGVEDLAKAAYPELFK
jgi:iron complex transport system substrate-binding protein